MNTIPRPTISAHRVLRIITEFHFAVNENHLSQRLSALPTEYKSDLWVYLMAAQKCESFEGCENETIINEMLENLSTLEWQKLTTDDLSLIFVSIHDMTVSLWLKFLDFCRTCSEYGNELPMEGIVKISNLFIDKCQAENKSYVKQVIQATNLEQATSSIPVDV